MLAKVAKKRADGGTSFHSLVEYIRHEVDENTGEIVGRGVVWTSRAILDPATAAKEMKLVALMNVRCTNPVYHYILTWRENDSPEFPEWREAVEQTLEALGFKGHQAVAVSHTNTGNFHVHVAVNRVHPDTYKAHYPEWSHRSLDRALRVLERRFGWAEDHGLYRWDERLGRPVKTEPHLLEQWRIERETAARAATGRAGDMEAFADRESLESYCRGEPAQAVRTAARAEGASWRDIHVALARYGLVLQPGDRGGYTVAPVNQPELRVKASKAFRELFAGKAGRAELEARLGAFQRLSADVAPPERTSIYKSSRPRRGENRELRAGQRIALRSQYRAYRRSVPAAALPSQDSIGKRRDAISAHFRAERATVKASALPAAERRAAYSLLAMQAAQAREALRLAIQAERQAARESAKPLSWREWVAERAAEGNAAAISALRGLAYADRRRRRQLEKEELSDEGNAICAADPGPQDPVPPAGVLQGVRWSVDRRTGAVTYLLRNGARLVDQGRRIRLDERAAAHPDSIKVALLLARQKFGPVLNINGDAAFRQRVVLVLATMRPPLDVRLADPALEALRVQLAQGTDRPAHPGIPTSGHSETPAPERAAPTPADTTRGQYAGPVVGIDPQHVYQDIGRGQVVRHELAALPSVPRQGDHLRIRYDQGRISVDAMPARAGRNPARPSA